MDDATRRSLHGIAELLIAGPQYRAHGTIRLRVTPGGFGGVAVPQRVEGTDLVWDGGRAPLTGTYRALAATAGITDPGAPGSYTDTSGVDPDEEIVVDAAAVAELTDWFARGDAGLRAFAPDHEPVLWPEHFDLAITVDEVNYGVSPGDGGHPDPYAYVGPWTPREGPFWNAAFGALRPATALPDADAVARFFAQGRAEAG
ncbi:hypothetical protein [Pseudonocardia hydrocarbonoxydans]|uniref:Uncharacterized protein n=1 Tax=Pseudonocardia hydrocarbonoxydans TaxID=76726 RepID=A0A4Y3WVZ3_9PSEU|nr:hypothetical protein [Pseudonocardia hydrocarbonoxydans]GEC22451.1 hypothetical protein PHY01_47340 [Pseudonocardia hydrocarbonoxydans]